MTEYAPNAATASSQYDNLDRLTVASGAYSAQYTYDLIGNLQTKVEAGTTRDLAYTLTTRPKHAPKTVDGITQTYDANGNLIADGSRAYIYDDENRLATVIYDAITMQFVYDPDGKRIEKTENGQTTVYIGKHYEKNLATGQVAKYYEALGQAVAVSVNGALTYLYRDHLGSTVATSGGASRSYLPYGSTRSSSGTSAGDRLYTGQPWRDAISLYDYSARFYDPWLGRFISPDTIVANSTNPQDLNRYTYARNNPLRFTDPSGHEPWDQWVQGQWDQWLRTLLGRALIFVPPPPSLPPIGFPDDQGSHGPVITAPSPPISEPCCVTRVVQPRDGTIADPAPDPDLVGGGIYTANDEATIKIGATKVSVRPKTGVAADEDGGDVGATIQDHHLFSNVNQKYTPQFRVAVGKYDLDLNGAWNIVAVPQNGRHPNAYHVWALDQLELADKYAGGNSGRFLEYIDREVRQRVVDNPAMLNKDWWNK